MKRLSGFLVVFALMVTINASVYNIDSFSECSNTYGLTHQVYDWDNVYIYGGRYSSENSHQTCRLTLKTADSSDRLKVDVQSGFHFDYDSKASLKVYDASSSLYSSDLKYTINSDTTSTPSTFTSSSDYVYIVLNRKCTHSTWSGTKTCSSDFSFTLYVTVVDDPALSYVSVGTIIGIVIGSLVGLVLLITVPICICCCCCAAASNSGNRRTAGPAVFTTTSNPGYTTQQYSVGVSNASNVQPYNTQYTYNQPTGQPVQSGIIAPPSYEKVTASTDQPQGYGFTPAGEVPYPSQQPPYTTQ